MKIIKFIFLFQFVLGFILLIAKESNVFPQSFTEIALITLGMTGILVMQSIKQ